MGRTPKPWYRADRDAWYATIKGKRHLLARGKEGRQDAVHEFHRLMASPEAKPSPEVAGETVASICNRYLDHARSELAPLTYEFYRRHLVPFGTLHRGLAASELQPHHILAWASSRPWNPTTRAGAITTVKRAFAWAARHGHITEDRVRTTEKPRPRRRESIPTQAELDRFLAAIDNPNFRDLVIALRESGCRPNEVIAMEANRFDPQEGTWTVANKTRNHGDQTRIVYLSDAMLDLSNRLARARPKGRMFVNSRGEPWKRHAIIHRFIRLRDKLGMGPEMTAYALRHLFVTDGLERGVPIATMAELVGHKNTAMISKVYSKLSERTAHLRDAVRRARGEKTGHDDKP